LGLPEPLVEEDYHRLSRAELSVWDKDHPKPEGGPAFERKLLRWLNTDAEKALAPVADSSSSYRSTVGAAVEVLIGRDLQEVGDVSCTVYHRQVLSGYVLSTGLLQVRRHGEEIPAVLLEPVQPSGRTVIWTTESGKAGLFDDTPGTDGPIPKPGVRKLLNAGATVVGLDLLYQGEFLADGKPLTQTTKVTNPREAGAYTFGYNRALFAQRVHDILAAIQFIRNEQAKADIGLIGLDSTGPIVAAASAQAGQAINRAAIDTHGFRFGEVQDLRDVNFLPGGAKYGDIPGLLALSAPNPLWLAGENGGIPGLVSTVYRRAGSEDKVVTGPSASGERESAAVSWIASK
jgi:hypothetical protein